MGQTGGTHPEPGVRVSLGLSFLKVESSLFRSLDSLGDKPTQDPTNPTSDFVPSNHDYFLNSWFPR